MTEINGDGNTRQEVLSAQLRAFKMLEKKKYVEQDNTERVREIVMDVADSDGRLRLSGGWVTLRITGAVTPRLFDGRNRGNPFSNGEPIAFVNQLMVVHRVAEYEGDGGKVVLEAGKAIGLGNDATTYRFDIDQVDIPLLVHADPGDFHSRYESFTAEELAELRSIRAPLFDAIHEAEWRDEDDKSYYYQEMATIEELLSDRGVVVESLFHSDTD